jgi:hypothetical protein
MWLTAMMKKPVRKFSHFGGSHGDIEKRREKSREIIMV